ncbi:MAG TPA: 50S ribosomal protein L28 [Cryomorphaceae bacterium]|nr:50S ribosomal protein L28 [Cryomorphaceae bacterium]
MAKTCELTGKKAMVGNNVSFSNRRTKRRFEPNLIKKKFYLAEEDKWVELIISTSALRTVNKIGIAKALKRAKEKGYYNGK